MNPHLVGQLAYDMRLCCCPPVCARHALTRAHSARRYDGQTFVKPPEVLTRDRLLATYEVRPTLAKLRSTLLGMGGILLVTAVLLFGLIRAGTDEDGVYGRGARPVPRQVTAGGPCG